MAVSSNLTIIKEGTLYLVHRLNAVIAIAMIGVLLAILSLLLQIHFQLPNESVVDVVLSFVCVTLPMELYFFPQFVMVCDATLEHSPLNQLGDWKLNFEARWPRFILGKILIYLACGMGMTLLIIPGLLVQFAFGWMPLRILLRGETIMQAAKGSLVLTSRYWKKMLSVYLLVLAGWLILLSIPSSLMMLYIKDETAYGRLVNPIFWLSVFLVSFIQLWPSACFLALYNKLERAMLEENNKV